MLDQLLVGAAVSACNITIHALVMTLVVRAARATSQRRIELSPLRLAGVMIVTVLVLMAAHTCRGHGLGAGLPDRRCCAGWYRPRLFCIRELHDAWLRRRRPGRGLAASWTDHGDEWRSAVRVVDRCDFRSAAKRNGEIVPGRWTDGPPELLATQFEGHKPCQKCCRIELTDDGFGVAKTSRQRMDRYEIAVAGRGQ